MDSRFVLGQETFFPYILCSWSVMSETNMTMVTDGNANLCTRLYTLYYLTNHTYITIKHLQQKYIIYSHILGFRCKTLKKSSEISILRK